MRRAVRRLLVTLAAVGTAIGAPLHGLTAQTNPGSTGTAATRAGADPLTLARALELAASSNPEIRRARNDMGLEAPANRAAWGAFLPSLQLSAGTSQAFNRRTVAEDIFGNPTENPDARTTYTSGSSQGVSLGLTLFEGGARFSRMTSARAIAMRRSRLAEVEISRVTGEVERQFFEAQRQQELVRTEGELLEQRRRDLEATERLFSLASKSRTDVLGAELEVQRQERALAQATIERRKALLALRTRIGDPAMAVDSIVPEPILVFDPAAEVTASELRMRAASDNPSILSTQAQLLEAEAGLGEARASRWPRIELSGSVSRSAFGPDQTALFEATPSDQSQGGVSLSISVPVFSGFSTSLRIAEAEVRTLNARETLRQEAMRVEEEVQARLLDLESAFRSHRISEGAARVAAERLRLAEEEYRLAVRSFEELQSVARDAADARREALTARYDFVMARIALEEALGGRLGTPGAGSVP